MNFTLGSPDAHSSPTTNCSAGDEDSDDHMPRGGDGAVMEREHMFDKVVTPSDVGKLNRLVIPKQHAEKYFPLDSSTNDKGLLLNFEDRNGKPWRFRYSYWNSSQSYVMTKGWSRFVKEKKLDAGDVVSFQRGIGDSGKDRLFIDWRRRPDAPPHQFSLHHRSNPHPSWNNNPIFLHPSPTPSDYSQFLHPNGVVSANPHPYHPYPYNTTVFNGNPFPSPSSGSIMYLRTGPGAAGPGAVDFGPHHAQGGSGGMVFESVPVVQGKAAAKRLRLFGVNMDCPISDSDQCHILSSSSTTTTTTLPQYSTISTILPPIHSSLDSSSSSPPSIIPSNHKGKSSISLDLDI